MTGQWQFWVDRGGTFTDIVARTPKGELVSHKLLSRNPRQYVDATIAGIEQVLDLYPAYPRMINQIRIGTTVATNALLERKGAPTALITTQGFADSLSIGYQQREQLFELNIQKMSPLYTQVVEIAERLDAHGNVLTTPDKITVKEQLSALFDQGFRALAIVFMHGYQFSQHEALVAAIAKEIGFTQVSTSHQVSKLIKFISRGDTTVVDAYLSPIVARYVERTSAAFPGVPLQFMQSSGGLIAGGQFKGKDAVLSGPAGGVVAMVETSKRAGFEHIIGFDMGGTSTDVSLYFERYERDWEATVAGVRMRAPMMSIHTVAAGGGSILSNDGGRLSVGPHSAGAYPGPCSYRNDGPLTVTDINVLLGKIQPDMFAPIFGVNGDLPLDRQATRDKFDALLTTVNQQNGQCLNLFELAQGYLTIAIEHMANAIKEISVAKGHNLDGFVMSCFGGAGAQHGCLVANVLGIRQIIIHPLSGVLSAFGMGLAKVSSIKQQSLLLELDDSVSHALDQAIGLLAQEVTKELIEQGFCIGQIAIERRVLIRYQGSDNAMLLPVGEPATMRLSFEARHRQQFGFFHPDSVVLVAGIECQASGESAPQPNSQRSLGLDIDASAPIPFCIRPVHFGQGLVDTPFHYRDQLLCGCVIDGPAIIIEKDTTVVIEPHWQGSIDGDDILLLTKVSNAQRPVYDEQCQPMLLEVFNNLFMHIAKEMGLALQASAMSVNIKERLDFSCAIFDHAGALVANAPHMPVHLGSMGTTVKSIIAQNPVMRAGDSYLLNSPYHGGTHLPDLTVVTPVFSPDDGQQLLFFVASRGHHGDIGGISPGSMPADSTNIEQEGVLFENFLLVRDGQFREVALIKALSHGKYPARNIAHNVYDLKAQLAANNKGINELFKASTQYGLPVLLAYMAHVQDAAEQGVVEVIKGLQNGAFSYALDQGTKICVSLRVDQERGRICVDFTGSSPQQTDNFNAPLAVTKAAVLYVFRTLVAKNIALNDGCLRPIDIIVPSGCMLNPTFGAAVVAGNVETSQVVTDALYGALGCLAASQGTMNNFTFGNQQRQFYETICGGSGAGPTFSGCDAVQTHMTNSRLTDPEVLETRFPVRLNRFALRANSGGVGAYNGGCGVIREIEFLAPMQGAILANRRRVAPFGVNGGGQGAVGETLLITANGEQQELASSAAITFNCGDKIVIKTPGGGAFGQA